MAAPRFLLHHAPQSRSLGTIWLLEEAGAEYDLHWHDLGAGTQKAPGYLALNPAGKVPALVDRGPDGTWQGVVVTEVAAVARYVADLLPGAGLAPAIGTPERAGYEFWLSYGPGVVEPALADLAFPRAQPAPSRALGWPPFAEVQARIEAALTGRRWLLGERFSAADVIVGGLLHYFSMIGLLQPGPEMARYIAAIDARPARQRGWAKGAQAP
jgi:glutathione S-transferase